MELELEPAYIIVRSDGSMQLRVEKPKDAGPGDAVPAHILITAWFYLYLIEHADEIAQQMPEDFAEVTARLHAVAHQVGLH